MAIKIYLEKAYDKVRWDFLKDTLVPFRFFNIWIKLIMLYVKTMQISAM